MVLVTASTLVAPTASARTPARSVAPTWKDVVKTLSDRATPESPNPCNRGDELCIGIVLGEMTRRMGPLAAKCSHLAAFGATYAIVTQQVGVGWPHAYRDPAYISHMDAVFAQAYFDAYDAWKRGSSDVAPAWQTAFDVAKAKSVTGLGDILLGMNAHISNDLPFVLERTGLTRGDGSDGYDDFAQFNGLLADLQAPLVDAVAQEFDPSIADVSVPGLFVGRDGLEALLGTWRAESWANAQRLVAATTPAARKAVADEIHATAGARALAIRAATSYIPGFSNTTDRDQYCRQQHP